MKRRYNTDYIKVIRRPPSPSPTKKTKNCWSKFNFSNLGIKKGMTRNMSNKIKTAYDASAERKCVT